MFGAGIFEVLIGIDAERKPLESIAAPLSATGGTGSDARGARPSGGPRPRTGRTAWAPLPQASRFPLDNPSLGREVDLLVGALRGGPPLGSMELARKVGARFWGPGRFCDAMRSAVASGRVRRVGRGRYVATGPAERRD